MIIYVDFDGTLYRGNELDLWTEPYGPIADKIKSLYEQGHQIFIYSCRSNLEICDKSAEDLMIAWLKKWDIPFDGIVKNKPLFDYLIDDRVISAVDKTLQDI